MFVERKGETGSKKRNEHEYTLQQKHGGQENVYNRRDFAQINFTKRNTFFSTLYLYKCHV